MRQHVGASVVESAVFVRAASSGPILLDRRGARMVKSISLLTRKDGMTHEQFMKHWVEVHAPLAHAVPGLRRYVQSHIVEERLRPDIPATDVDIDGIAELWFDDQQSFEAAARSPEMKTLQADGAKFIGRLKSYVVEEMIVIG